MGNRIRDNFRHGAAVERHRCSDGHFLMSYQDLKALAESYPLQEREALMALAQEYRSRNEREILEIAAIATDVSLDSVLNLRLEPEANPQFLEAFRLQYPNVDIDSLSGASDERLRNYLKIIAHNGGQGQVLRGAGKRARLDSMPESK